MTCYGMEYAFGQVSFSSPFLAMLSLLGLFCTCSLADHVILKNALLRESSTQQQAKLQCVIIIILMSHPKDSTILGTKKKINSIPTEKRAIICTSYQPSF